MSGAQISHRCIKKAAQNFAAFGKLNFRSNDADHPEQAVVLCSCIEPEFIRLTGNNPRGSLRTARAAGKESFRLTIHGNIYLPFQAVSCIPTDFSEAKSFGNGNLRRQRHESGAAVWIKKISVSNNR